MKTFICSRSIDQKATETVVNELYTVAKDSIVIQQEIEHTENWKESAEEKILQSSFALFVLGADTYTSKQILWELEKAKEHHKQIIGYCLSTISSDCKQYFSDFYLFDNVEYLFGYMLKSFEKQHI